MATIFITGGSSGIGAGLAKAFAARGDTVIIAGRNRARLDAVAGGSMAVEELDVADPAAIAACAARVGAAHPGLDTVINNAGVQRLLDFAADPPPGPDAVGEEIGINLTGAINVASAFLPLLRRQRAAQLVNVGSGLGYVPLVAAPIYSATKAAMHAFTIALREQLRATGVQVVEIIPPVVATALHDGLARTPPNPMPLDKFVAAAMKGLDGGGDEIAVGLAGLLRIGARLSPRGFLKIVNKPR